MSENPPHGTDQREAHRSACWFAIWVMANAEFTVCESLKAARVKVLLPIYTEVTEWSDRKKTIIRPLFPGYLFAQAREEDMPVILRIAGVIEILPTSLRPLPIDEAQIEKVRIVLASRRPVVPCPHAAGDEVVIAFGPLAGLKGLVLRTKNGTHVIVRIEMLQRSISVELDAADAKALAA